MTAPSTSDMEAAKLLYVQLKFDPSGNPDVPSMDALRGGLGDGKLTEPWSNLEGLRHKYFIYNDDTGIVSGVYVFFDQASLDTYMKSELFAMHEKMPHFSSVVAQVIDVMPGTEESIEKTAWANNPPTREDLVKAKMLIVTIDMKYDTGIEGLPANKDHLYGFIASGYTKEFSGLKGLRGKYFGYDDSKNQCYGFYTFVDQESLDEYMASDLFKKQGEPPHIEKLTYAVHEVLPGTERSMDMGSWKGAGNDAGVQEKVEEEGEKAPCMGLCTIL